VSGDPPTPRAVPMTAAHAAEAARLHVAGIPTGFLSSLGPRFLRLLYEAVAAGRQGFGFVVGDPRRLLGFVANAVHVGRLYRETLRGRLFELALAVGPRMIDPSVLRRALETLLYPAQVQEGLPEAELLSIVVRPECRGEGIGRILVEATAGAFRRRGVRSFRVTVGDGLAANRFYLKLGFRPAARHDMHGRRSNIYLFDVV
jgi:ribosomal protein S18 acetylase RimI-like enzyme